MIKAYIQHIANAHSLQCAVATFPVPRVPSEPDDAAMPLVPAKTAPFDTRGKHVQ